VGLSIVKVDQKIEINELVWKRIKILKYKLFTSKELCVCILPIAITGAREKIFV
jgi:hypothetical protein